MRYLIAILFPLLLFANSYAQLESDIEEDKEYIISAGIFPKVDSISESFLSIWPELYFGYESNMSENLAGFFRFNLILPAEAQVKLKETPNDSVTKMRPNGVGIGLNLGARYYISELMRGFYVGPAVGYYRYNQQLNFNTTSSEYEIAVNSIRGSMIIGYRYVGTEGFTLHIYGGIMLDHKAYGHFIDDTNIKNLGSRNFIKPDIGVSVGYHFE